MKTGFILSQEGQQIQDILNYVEQQLPGTLEALSKAIGDEATRATNKENELLRAIGDEATRATNKENELLRAIGDEATRATNKENELLRAIGGLIPKTEKGSANGVASLNGNGKIPTAQAQFAMRGNLVAADIDSTALQSGFYRVIGQRLGEEILGGDEANGVLIQYSDGYKEQQLMVGRAAGASAGEQVEIYTRRYLPTPKRWTAWSKAGGGSGGGEVYMVNIVLQGGNYVMDKTYEEVRAAAEGGAVVIATYGNEQYMLGSYDLGSIYFYTMVGSSIISYFYFGYQMPGEYRQINIDPNLLIVTINGDKASHSPTEIAEAVTDGKMPVLKVGKKFFLLFSISGGSAIFRRMDGFNIVASYVIEDQKQILEEFVDNSIGQIEDVHIFSPQEGQVLVYIPEHEEEEMIVPAGWYNRTLSYPSMSQYEALVARVAALEQNQ